MTNRRKVSKTLMMMCRRECTFPVKARYVLGLKSSNPQKERGTDVHDIIDKYWKTGELADYEPYTGNFRRIVKELSDWGIRLWPQRWQFFVEDKHSRGQADFELIIEGRRCVGEIKTGKPPSELKKSDMRLELGFYAKMTDAAYMMAIFLGGKGALMFEPIKPALLKRVDKAVAETEALMKSGHFVRKQGRLCEWCDPDVKMMCGMEIIKEGMK